MQGENQNATYNLSEQPKSDVCPTRRNLHPVVRKMRG